MCSMWQKCDLTDLKKFGSLWHLIENNNDNNNNNNNNNKENMSIFEIYWKILKFSFNSHVIYFYHSGDMHNWRSKYLSHYSLIVQLIHIFEFRSLKEIMTMQLKETEHYLGW